jgi:hypothetical protein
LKGILTVHGTYIHGLRLVEIGQRRLEQRAEEGEVAGTSIALTWDFSPWPQYKYVGPGWKVWFNDSLLSMQVILSNCGVVMNYCLENV